MANKDRQPKTERVVPSTQYYADAGTKSKVGAKRVETYKEGSFLGIEGGSEELSTDVAPQAEWDKSDG